MTKEKISKPNEAYEKIKDLILNHGLITGQKLIYRDLEERLGMTKTPIINGLMMLEKEGLVVSKRNRGFYISEINPHETEQIFDLRERLEEIAIELAITNGGPKALSSLRKRLKEYQEYRSVIYDNKRRSLDIEFHLEIAKMGKNLHLVNIMKQFYEKAYFNVKIAYLSPYVGKFKKDHSMIFEAIRKQDVNYAKEIIRSHNRKTKELLCSIAFAETP